ncbi:hypothetical protein DFH08DRAFT_950139 [Mycena albidolilacea]|uniref:Uncharacterized protein n=1 Tax=Mycena albidolilacea TaxID=1033008 RepID=A0AAD7API7_9AGAR|nr:hypothetical protein DFH08DRAFT_950139 [Mycena albidolilacea]
MSSSSTSYSVSTFTAPSSASKNSAPQDYTPAFAALRSVYGLGGQAPGATSKKSSLKTTPPNPRRRPSRSTPLPPRRAKNPLLARCIPNSDSAVSLRKTPAYRSLKTLYLSEIPVWIQGTSYSPSPSLAIPPGLRDLSRCRELENGGWRIEIAEVSIFAFAVAYP